MGEVDIARPADLDVKTLSLVSLRVCNRVIGRVGNGGVVNGDGGGITNLSGSCPVAVELDFQGFSTFCAQIIGEGMDL